MPTRKKAREHSRRLNLGKGDGRIVSLGITPFTSLTQSAIDADATDPERSVESLDAALAMLLDMVARKRTETQADARLTDVGRRDRQHEIAVRGSRDVFEVVAPVANHLAGRIKRARDDGSGSSERLGGREIVQLLTGRTTVAAFDPARDGADALLPGFVSETFRALRDLADQGKGEELNGILHDAATTADVVTWAALDHRGVPEWLRRKILGMAMVTPEMDAQLHRRLRSSLNPEKAALMGSLVELGRHVVSNARTAIDAIDKVGFRPEPNGERLEHRVARTLEKLTEALAGLGEIETTIAPSIDPT